MYMFSLRCVVVSMRFLGCGIVLFVFIVYVLEDGNCDICVWYVIVDYVFALVLFGLVFASTIAE